MTILADISNTIAYKDWKDKVHSLIPPESVNEYWLKYDMKFIYRIKSDYWFLQMPKYKVKISKPMTEYGLQQLIDYRDSKFPGINPQCSRGKLI